MPLTYQREEVGTQKFASLANTGIFDNEQFIVEIFESEEWFDALESFWKDLAFRTDAPLFMTFEWARAWWRHYGEHSRRSLFIISIWEGTHLIGLAPFYKEFSSVRSHIMEERLQLIGSGGSDNEQIGYMSDFGISDFLDVLVDKKFEEPVADLLCGILISGMLVVDRINFHSLRNDSYVMSYMYPVLKKNSADFQLQKTNTSPYIDLNKYRSFRDYIKTKRPEVRQRFARVFRGMNRSGGFSIENLTSREELKEGIAEIIRLHQQKWNTRGFTGVFQEARYTRFFKDFVETAFMNGWVHLKRATDKEGTCASRLLFKYNNRYYDYTHGFDNKRNSAEYQPVLGLLIDAVKDGFSLEASRIELLRGEEHYKYYFTAEKISNWKLSIKVGKDSAFKKIFRSSLRLLALAYKRLTREHRLRRLKHRKRITKLIPRYPDHFKN